MEVPLGQLSVLRPFPNGRISGGSKDMNKPVIAKRSDWKNEPMPDKHKTFIYRKTFSEKEMTLLHLGHIPEAMEDKWFWYKEGSTLYAHRS